MTQEPYRDNTSPPQERIAQSTTVCRFENADGQWWEIDMDPNERTVRYSLPEGVVLTRNATSLELHLVETLANGETP